MILPIRLNLILDDYVRFNKMSFNFELVSKLKLISFFTNRYGLGVNIVKLVFLHMGFLPSLKMSDLPESFVTYELRYFFLNHRSVLDANVKLFISKQIKFYILLKTIRGYKHLAGFPVRGQRRRSNAKTAAKRLFFKFSE